MDERFEKAIQFCFKATSVRPSIDWPYLKAAHLAARLGQSELTWKLLDDAERFAGCHPGADPHNAGTYLELAKCNLLLFRPSISLAHLRKSRELGKSAEPVDGEL